MQQIMQRAPGPARTGSWLVFGCTAAFLVPFLVVGTGVAIGALREDRWTTDVLIRLGVGLFFAAMALAGIGGIWWVVRAGAAMAALRQQYPEQPWMWRPDWARGEVRDQTKGATIAITLFAVIWNVITWPMVYAASDAVKGEKMLWIFVILFPAAGLLLAGIAIRQVLQARKFGVSVCRPERMPIQRGRAFRGELEAHVQEPPANGFTMRLMCVRRITTRGSKNSSTDERTLWMEEVTVPGAAAAPSPMGMRVPFTIPIAHDVQPTDESDSNDRILWRLQVTAELPGVDYEASFELPVFDTGEPLPESESSTRFASQSSSSTLGAAWTPSPASGIELGTTYEGKEEIRVSPHVDFGSLFGLVLFTACWIGGVVLMVRLHAPLIFPIAFGFIALVLLFAIVDAVVGRTRIVVDLSGVTIRYTWLGVGLTRVIEAPKVQSIVTTPAKKRYSVEVRSRDGTSAPVARGLREKSDADAVVARMLHALGR